MRKRITVAAVRAAAGALAIFFCAAAAAGETERFTWERLPDLPKAASPFGGLPLSGAFIGEHNQALIVAGGQFLTAGVPAFSDEIHVLVKQDGGSWRWLEGPSFKLPFNRAFGSAVSASEGLVLAGGYDSTFAASGEVLLLKFEPQGGRIKIETLPSLPVPLAYQGGAAAGNVIFMVEGNFSSAGGALPVRSWSYDLTNKHGPVWKELSERPSGGCDSPAVAVQRDGSGPGLYVFDGFKAKDDSPLPDRALRYDPGAGTWTGTGPGFIAAGKCGSGYPGAAVSVGAHGILLIGQRKVLAFNTITRAWSQVSNTPGFPPYTPTAAKWGNGFVVMVQDETGPQIWKASPIPHPGFGAVNYAALGLYLAAMVGIGVYFSKREKTTDDYFKAGGRVPWWAAGLSIFGTGLSAITFVSVPAKTFATDLTYFPTAISQFLAIPIVIALYLPLYRRLKFTTSYQYLEARFNLFTRLLGAALFLLFQFLRFAIVLYLPSLALSLATGIDLKLCIILMGGLSIVYTVMGGIEAVIWTDVLQVIALMGGSLLAFIIIVLDIRGGIPELGRVALSDHKLHTFDFALTLAKPTLWVTLLGGFAYTLIYAGSDQTYVQRYQTTASEKDAAAGLWTFGILTIPAAIIFYGLGAALYVHYKQDPASLDPTLAKPDSIFPWFIMSELPAGVSGLVVAGLFAAAMSSLDSSMNSAAAVIVTDLHRRFRPNSPEKTALRLAKIVTVAFGLAGTLMALAMTQWNIESLWDEFQKWIGLIAGGLGGLFLLGILSKRANGPGAIIGLILSAIVQYIVSKYLHAHVHLLLYTFTGFASSMLFGWLASLVIPAKPHRQYTLAAVKSEGRGPGSEG